MTTINQKITVNQKRRYSPSPQEIADAIDETINIFNEGNNWVEGEWETEIDQQFSPNELPSYCSIGGINKAILGSGHEYAPKACKDSKKLKLRKKVIEAVAKVIENKFMDNKYVHWNHLSSAEKNENIVISYNDGAGSYQVVEEAFKEARDQVLSFSVRKSKSQ